MTILTFYLDVDWDGDGVFEEDEAGYLQAFTLTRGREYMLKASAKGFADTEVGTAEITLKNVDGRFDPLNTGSAIYPNVKPGAEAKLRVYDGSTTYSLIRGRIADIVPTGAGARKKVKLKLVDGAQWLKDHAIRSATFTAKATDSAIDEVLTLAAWPAAWGDALTAGDDTLSYWWADGESALEAIDALAQSEVGFFYIAGDGKATFKPRNKNYNQTSAFTFNGDDILEDGILFAQPWETVRNLVQVQCYPRVLQTSGVLWTYNEKPYLEPNGSLEVFATFTYDSRNVAALNLIEPVTVTDFAANTLVDGTGTDVTANVTVTMTAYAKSCKLVIANTSATEVAYLTLLQVRGQAVDCPNVAVVEVDNSGGAIYGARTLALDLAWQQNTPVAFDLATWLSSYLANPLGAPKLALVPQPTRQFSELFTVFTLNLSGLGINQQYRVAQITHDWDISFPNLVFTKWTCESVDTNSYFTLDDSNLDETDVLAY